MPKLLPISRREFINKLKNLCFDVPYQGGDYQFMVKEQCKITVPNPHVQKDIPKYIVQLVIKQLEISREEWEKA